MTTLTAIAFVFTLLLSLLVIVGELRDRRLGRALNRQLRQAFNPRRSPRRRAL